MEAALERSSSRLYAILRIVAGLSFMQHGAQKLFGLLGGFGGQPGQHAQWFSWMGLAGVIEFFGGLLIVLGLFAAVTALVCSVEMVVAYFWVHAPRGFAPIQNGGERAVLYCFIFLFIASQGAGIWSLDVLRGRKSVSS